MVSPAHVCRYTRVMTDMTYDRYLALDALLGAQHPLSDLDDEMLFIVIHQTKELWLKQTIAELAQAMSMVRADRLIEAYKGLARVSRIQAVMTLSWDVLATMTPSDYTRFRHVLGTSSGLPIGPVPRGRGYAGCARGAVSWEADACKLPRAQACGMRPMRRWRVRALRYRRRLWRATGPGLCARRGRRGGMGGGVSRYEAHWPLYQLAEKLVDIDDAMATWRHKHVLTVSRIIGGKRGTGGTAGVPYLESDAGEAGVSGAVVAADGAVSAGDYRHLFQRSIAAAPDRLHFAAHSHHLWPDASYVGQHRLLAGCRPPRRPQMGSGDG